MRDRATPGKNFILRQVFPWKDQGSVLLVSVACCRQPYCLRDSRLESLNAQATDIDPACPVNGEFRNNFTNSRRVFKSMARTRRRNYDSIAIRMDVENEVCVRRCRIKTSHCRFALIRKPGQPPSYVVGVRGLFFCVADGSSDFIGSCDDVVLFTRQFNRLAVKGGKTIKPESRAVPKDPDKNRELSG